MAREIIKEDIPKVKSLTEKVLGTCEFAEIERMGGLTNHTYRVKLEDGSQYAVRLPGEGTEEMIVRGDEKKSTALACDLQIDARLLYFGDDGAKVTEYISNAVTMSADTLKEPVRIKQMAEIFRKLHSCGVDTGVPFEVFGMADSYKNIIKDKNVPMFDDFDRSEEAVMSIKVELDSTLSVHKVPCHNDPLCENWVVGDGKMYLIDWEYAGMNDGMWDIADVSIEACFDKESDALFLREYLGREPSLNDEKHFLANKIYVDYLWTLWAKARVPYDGQPMEDWAVERYGRLKGFLEDYKKL